jgi:hypothetical protein
MIYDIEDEDIVREVQGLVKSIDDVKDKVDIYAEVMKQLFLSGSNKN